MKTVLDQLVAVLQDEAESASDPDVGMCGPRAFAFLAHVCDERMAAVLREKWEECGRMDWVVLFPNLVSALVSELGDRKEQAS